MSLCVIVRDKNDLWIGADTAVSVEMDGKSCRVANAYCEKVFQVGDDIVFCSGLLAISSQIKATIMAAGAVDIVKLQSTCKKLVSELPQHLQGENHETGIIVCKGDGDIFSLVQAQRFEAVLQPAPQGIQILSGGFESEKAQKIAGDALRQGACAMDIFGFTYSQLASEIIGGDLILFHRKNNGKLEKFVFAIQEPKEKLNYAYGTVAHCRFKGVVQASDFQDLSGRSMIDSKYKITSDYLNLNGLNVGNGNLVIDSGGNISMRGNINMTGGSISWGNINEKGSAAYQTAVDAQIYANQAFNAAADASGDAAEAARIAKQIADGKYTKGTFISGREIFSPTIRANEFAVLPSDETDQNGGYLMYNYYNGQLMPIFKLSYWAGIGPEVTFDSPCSAYANWNFPRTTFRGSLDFSGATVSGLDATFA